MPPLSPPPASPSTTIHRDGKPGTSTGRTHRSTRRGKERPKHARGDGPTRGRNPSQILIRGRECTCDAHVTHTCCTRAAHVDSERFFFLTGSRRAPAPHGELRQDAALVFLRRRRRRRRAHALRNPLVQAESSRSRQTTKKKGETCDVAKCLLATTPGINGPPIP